MGLDPTFVSHEHSPELMNRKKKERKEKKEKSALPYLTYTKTYVRNSATTSALMLTCLKLRNAYVERSLSSHQAYRSPYPTSISYPSLITRVWNILSLCRLPHSARSHTFWNRRCMLNSEDTRLPPSPKHRAERKSSRHAI